MIIRGISTLFNVNDYVAYKKKKVACVAQWWIIDLNLCLCLSCKIRHHSCCALPHVNITFCLSFGSTSSST